MLTNAIVSNTGPIIALAKVEILHLLPTLFERVLVPESVYREVLAGGEDNRAFLDACKAGSLRTMAVSFPIDPLLIKLLDQGEASVILVAREQGIEQVLIDERKGRKVARDVYGLNTLGTIRVLLEAKQRGLIAEIRTPLSGMLAHGYRIHEDIVRAALLQAGENT